MENFEILTSKVSKNLKTKDEDNQIIFQMSVESKQSNK